MNAVKMKNSSLLKSAIRGLKESMLESKRGTSGWTTKLQHWGRPGIARED